MKSEYEKCMAGEIYDCHDSIFISRKAKATEWMQRYNALPYADRTRRYEMIRDLFAAVGANVSVGDGIIVGFGDNIRLGNNVSINYRCILNDCNTITIGDDVLIAPGVQINTATHPVPMGERLVHDWDAQSGRYRWNTYALPIRIGNGVWIGANACWRRSCKGDQEDLRPLAMCSDGEPQFKIKRSDFGFKWPDKALRVEF